MKLRDLLVCGFCLTAGLLFATAAAADRRVALVIGNAAYKNASSLSNTINDSKAIANLFKSVGFEVIISRSDLGVVDFKRAVREFLFTAENADIAVVYYAGHGVEIGGTNYLVPVDAKLGRDYDVEDEAVALERIIWALQSVKRLRLILLDACRDNPFPAKLRSASTTRAPAKGGLTKIEDVSADTLVAYAAKAGSVSYDGDGANSPYATALVKHLAEPGLDIRIALGRVRDEVLALTGGRQEPFIYGSLGGATIPLVPALAPAKRLSPVAAALLDLPSEPAPPPRAPAASLAPAAPAAAKPEPAKPQPPAQVALAPAAPAPARPEPVKPPAQAAIDPAVACSRDEARLAQLRANPSREEIASLQRDLGCVRLRPQLTRLFESVAAPPPPPVPAAPPPVTAAPVAAAPVVAAPANAAPANNDAQIKQAQAAPPPPANDACSRDTARLAQLRAEPTIEAITKFERELSCNQIRPQLKRLRESLGLD